MSNEMNSGELSAPPETGVYLVVTRSGSKYQIDLDSGTVVRHPDLDDPDPSKNLRQDALERPLLGMSPLEIGRDLVMVLDIRGDGVPTFRRSAPVVSWERLA